jgi:hypothetical protein
VPQFRCLRTIARPGPGRRTILAGALAMVSLATGVLLATVALAPGASAAATRPSCARHALWQGLSRGDAQVHHARIVRPFGCDGNWAYAAVETSRFEFTSLFQARGGRWVSIQRSRPCARREVPRRIRHAACDSN